MFFYPLSVVIGHEIQSEIVFKESFQTGKHQRDGCALTARYN